MKKIWARALIAIFVSGAISILIKNIPPYKDPYKRETPEQIKSDVLSLNKIYPKRLDDSTIIIKSDFDTNTMTMTSFYELKNKDGNYPDLSYDNRRTKLYNMMKYLEKKNYCDSPSSDKFREYKMSAIFDYKVSDTEHMSVEFHPSDCVSYSSH